MSEIGIFSCPFCNGVPLIHQHDEDESWRVICCNPSCLVSVEAWDWDDKQKAIDAWNGRNPSYTELKNILEKSARALDDWILTYAPEHCDEKNVEEAWVRITNNGGTLSYITDIRTEIEEFIEKL